MVVFMTVFIFIFQTVNTIRFAQPRMQYERKCFLNRL
jgi:hypothetical protein